MKPYLSEGFGNPSSQHWAGAPSREAVIGARKQVALLLGCDPSEIVFTSGGTESNNFALKGVFFSRGCPLRQPHIITSQIEHPAILAPCRFLGKWGAEITYVPVDCFGRVDPDDVRKAVRPETILISIMHANNEVGTIQPITEISKIAREKQVLFHTDAAQTVGKIPVEVDQLGVDLLSLAGHKLYAPKGVGVLYVRKGVGLEPLLHGGNHEAGRRAGTENVLLIVGLGAACRIARDWVGNDRIQKLTEHFWHLLQESFGAGVTLNGHPSQRLPNTLNISFPGRQSDDLLGRLEGVAASAGSACHAGRTEMSPVLRAMGLEEKTGLGAVRFSLGRTTAQKELEYVVKLLRQVVSS